MKERETLNERRRRADAEARRKKKLVAELYADFENGARCGGRSSAAGSSI